MTPYQMFCGSPFKMVVNLDFWHLWVFFLLVLKKFRGWQYPSKKVKVRLLSDFFWKINFTSCAVSLFVQIDHFPFSIFMKASVSQETPSEMGWKNR